MILVRRETNPDDLPGMIAAQGILTSRGGKTSHAAVVARGMGKTCVCGAEDLRIDPTAGTVTVGGTVLHAGDIISIDGTTGTRLRRRGAGAPVARRPLLRGRADARDGDPLLAAVHRLLGHADAVRRLGVHANADTGAGRRPRPPVRRRRHRAVPHRAHVPRRAA